MRASYSLVHLTNASCPPPELIRTAAQAGFDCVSLRSIPTRMRRNVQSVQESVTGKMPFALADDKQLLRETREAARSGGIVIHDTENARIFDGVDVRDYERDLEAAAELGIREILTNIWTEDSAFYEEAFARLCELAAPYGQNINLEFVTWSGVMGLGDAVRLLQKTGRPNQGIVLDTLHFYRSRNTTGELKGLPEQWFRYVHLCDCPAEIPESREELIQTGLAGRLFPGEGAVDIRGILDCLPPVVRGIEAPNPERMAESGFLAYVTEALRRTKQYLGEG